MKTTMKKAITTFGLSLIIGVASAQNINTKSSNTNAVNFSFPIKPNSTLSEEAPAYSVKSDSYWFETTGAQLNKGLTISATQSNVALLISSASAENSVAQRDATPLNMASLKLTSLNDPDKSVIKYKVSQEQLLQAGMLGNSLALTTTDDTQPGNLILSTSQPLSLEDQYIVTVKEKGSAFTLNMDMQRQSFTHKDTVLATAKLAQSGKMMKSAMQAELVAPDGTVSKVSRQTNATGETVFTMDSPDEAIPPAFGLYELRVKTSNTQDGMKISRNAKVAFALTNDSGSLNKVVMRDQKGLRAIIGLDAEADTRFEARGILYGTNQAGEMIPVMETHTAQDLKSGVNKLVMEFDKNILAKADVNAPFELKNIRLYDQKQMGMIDTYSETVTFNEGSR